MEFNLEGVYDLALQHSQGPPVVHHGVWGPIENSFNKTQTINHADQQGICSSAEAEETIRADSKGMLMQYVCINIHISISSFYVDYSIFPLLV